MIGRIRDRSTFADLRRRGRRSRSGPLTVWYLAEPAASSPRAAFAVNRKVGPAVTRNLIRRRLRHALHDLAASAPAAVPPGAYLLHVTPAVTELRYDELATLLAHVLAPFAGATA